MVHFIWRILQQKLQWKALKRKENIDTIWTDSNNTVNYNNYIGMAETPTNTIGEELCKNN